MFIKHGDNQPISQIVESSDLDPKATLTALEQTKEELVAENTDDNKKEKN